jgi:hypothetical protein
VEFQAPAAGVDVSLLQPDGVPVNGSNTETTTLSDGSFFLCAPVEAPFFVQAAASGYQSADSSILIEPGGPDFFFVWNGPFALISTQIFPAFEGELSPSVVPGTSMVVLSLAGTTCGAGGYTVGVALPDGGVLADGGPLPFNAVYVNGQFPDPSLTATTDGGEVFLYNIDSSLTTGAIAITLSNPNVPADCLAPAYTDEDWTGLVPVAEGSFSEGVVVLQ